MRYRILPYRQGSKGAKALAEALGGKVLKLEGSSFVQKADDIVVNWGRTDFGGLDHEPDLFCLLLNNPIRIKNASNKLMFFRAMRDGGLSDIIPEFWEKKEEIPGDAYPVVCRTVLAGHSGDGIVIASSEAELVPAPLYVRYVKKQDEYRVHVGRKSDDIEVISLQRKARRLEVANPNWQVRNHQNGFNFVRQGVNPPSGVLEVAKKALLATGLDFGAVDVIYNTQKGKALVLEINTAPGLEGQTVQDYSNFFKSLNSQ